MAWVVPATYHSSAVVKVADGGTASRTEAEKIRSTPVLVEAARLLQSENKNGSPSDNPMSQYLLWSSLTVKADAGPNLLRVEASGSGPEESRRILLAVVEAYHRVSAAERQPAATASATATAAGSTAGAALCLYMDEPGSGRAPVPDETRMVLGMGGVAGLGLVMAIPLLLGMERAMPLRRDPALTLASPRRLA